MVGLFLLGALVTTARVASAVPTNSDCPDANCSSSDLNIDIVVVSTPANPTCDSPSDTVQLEVTHQLSPQGGNTRYDVGIYVSRDGGVLNCLADILESPQATGFFKQDADKCGDINDVVTHVQNYTVPCVDEDEDGFLDPVLICQSWANNVNQVLACTETNVIEGTAAHCNCLQIDPEIPVGGVPTMSQYGLAALALLLISVGILVVRRTI